jgi:hypothetical protein
MLKNQSGGTGDTGGILDIASWEEDLQQHNNTNNAQTIEQISQGEHLLLLVSLHKTTNGNLSVWMTRYL